MALIILSPLSQNALSPLAYSGKTIGPFRSATYPSSQAHWLLLASATSAMALAYNCTHEKHGYVYFLLDPLFIHSTFVSCTIILPNKCLTNFRNYDDRGNQSLGSPPAQALPKNKQAKGNLLNHPPPTPQKIQTQRMLDLQCLQP